MKQYVLFYNQRASHDGYLPQVRYFNVGPDAKDMHDGYLAPHHYEDKDTARYAMYAFLEDVKQRWPDLNEYPYGKPRMFEREVSEWIPME